MIDSKWIRNNFNEELTKRLSDACPNCYYSMEIKNADEITKHDIINYIKNDWIDHDIPINNYSKWITIYDDMSKLSKQYPNIEFYLYVKDQTYIDDIKVKIFMNGDIIDSRSKVNMNITLTLGYNNDIKKVDDNGMVILDNNNAIILNENDRGLHDMFTVAADMFSTVGEVVVQGGKAIGSASAVFALVGLAATIVSKINEMVDNVKFNRRKIKRLALRCNLLTEQLRKIPTYKLDGGLVTMIVHDIENSCDLIEAYSKKWYITQFISGRATRKKLTEIIKELNESWLTMGPALDLDKINDL